MADTTDERKNPQEYITTILDTAVRVITRPVDFYREMPKSGGFTDPLIFLVVLAFATGVVQAVLGMFGIGYGGPFGLAALIVSPIVAAIFGFVGAAIVFVIWKLMGSMESYEVAYRCTAYAAAISPLTTIVQPVPYIGPLIGLAWGIYLMIVASTEAHGIPPKRAQIVFGAIALVFLLLSLSTEYSARRFTSRMDNMGAKIDQMSPEEAGKKMGEFLKGLQKGAKE
ncbi:MAG: Yip1 family protein [Syntrophobacteraceae bacterium]